MASPRGARRLEELGGGRAALRRRTASEEDCLARARETTARTWSHSRGDVLGEGDARRWSGGEALGVRSPGRGTPESKRERMSISRSASAGKEGICDCSPSSRVLP